ncbi:hypothetical protein Plhal304r1_c067g0154721 [Plasmopara halstedii]
MANLAMNSRISSTQHSILATRSCPRFRTTNCVHGSPFDDEHVCHFLSKA